MGWISRGSVHFTYFQSASYAFTTSVFLPPLPSVRNSYRSRVRLSLTNRRKRKTGKKSLFLISSGYLMNVPTARRWQWRVYLISIIEVHHLLTFHAETRKPNVWIWIKISLYQRVAFALPKLSVNAEQPVCKPSEHTTMLRQPQRGTKNRLSDLQRRHPFSRQLNSNKNGLVSPLRINSALIHHARSRATQSR